MMADTIIFIYLLMFIPIQITSSLPMFESDQSHNESDDLNVLSEFLSFDNTKTGHLDCFAKALLANLFYRNHRASISRPYFHHRRGSRDNDQYSTKNMLAYGSHSRKQARRNEDASEISSQTTQRFEQENHLDDFSKYLTQFLHDNNISMIYEDETFLCLSLASGYDLIEELQDDLDTHHGQHNKEQKHSENV